MEDLDNRDPKKDFKVETNKDPIVSEKVRILLEYRCEGLFLNQILIIERQ